MLPRTWVSFSGWVHCKSETCHVETFVNKNEILGKNNFGLNDWHGSCARSWQKEYSAHSSPSTLCFEITLLPWRQLRKETRNEKLIAESNAHKWLRAKHRSISSSGGQKFNKPELFCRACGGSEACRTSRRQCKNRANRFMLDLPGYSTVLCGVFPGMNRTAHSSRFAFLFPRERKIKKTQSNKTRLETCQTKAN